MLIPKNFNSVADALSLAPGAIRGLTLFHYLDNHIMVATPDSQLCLRFCDLLEAAGLATGSAGLFDLSDLAPVFQKYYIFQCRRPRKLNSPYATMLSRERTGTTDREGIPGHGAECPDFNGTPRPMGALVPIPLLKRVQAGISRIRLQQGKRSS